ncbi:MAG: RNA polymerase sigma factor [Planctomycetes bacterium]|nr:RNA polymerase sigma factor [Planctomycetota bacterium]MCB9910121.1 RNA polymerase sigma factor [Planctomycetota bacterium]MCB9913112.1 RNA polymerase sigma factor [Planctomycetota bacterium]HPF13458.1 RNA polymerase sigma factor [Planctomycetota bacterium]HRV81415.1 RNA polymerase sigma factor [Planctomycetota bacterium]
MQSEPTLLMARLHGGDLKAFDALFRLLRGRAYQIAFSMVGSREDAMDLTQETFLRVFKARDSFDPNQPFLPWFHRILRNTCFSFLRKNRRVRESSLTALDADGEPVDFEITDDSPSPEDHVSVQESHRMYLEALRTLSATDREILILRHHQNLSYKEIAQTLGIPEGTVMSRLFHARRRMRDALSPSLDPSFAEDRPRLEAIL